MSIAISIGDFELDILDPHFGGSTRVKLNREDSPLDAGRIIDVDTDISVERRLDLAADCDNLVSIPIARLEVFLAAIFAEKGAAVFFVEFSPPSFANVGLVASHFPVGKRF